jgi:glycosyltransferase involved in cell wall biosynthesis
LDARLELASRRLHPIDAEEHIAFSLIRVSSMSAIGSPTLCVFLPVRNPGEEFISSIRSLCNQSDKDFTVLLSDNYSSAGRKNLEIAAELLRAAQIPFEVVKPPQELGRVEHWNYAAFYPSARWVKPLFAGDELFPDFIARFHDLRKKYPQATLFRASFEMNSAPCASPPCRQEYLSPQDFLDYFPHYGNWLGGPVNSAYRKDSLIAIGGFDTSLPAVADYKVAALCALDGGVLIESRCLARFVLHDKRFSKGINKRRVNGLAELWLILHQVTNFARDRKLALEKKNFRSGLWLQAKIDYWYPQKEKIKTLLPWKK